MKLLFITGLYPKGDDSYFRNNCKGPFIQNAPNVFQWALVDGLRLNNVDFKVASCPFLPSFPTGYKQLYSPDESLICDNLEIGRVLKYNTLLLYKYRSIRRAIYRYAKKWCIENSNDKLLNIIVYTTWPEYVWPIIELKKSFPQVRITTIVTDLIDDAFNFDANKSFLKRLQIKGQKRSVKKSYAYIDKFVLLTKYMVEKIPESYNKYIVVEGICSPYRITDCKKVNGIKQISYTGGLHNFVGIREFVDAFMQTKDPAYRLVICGSGENEQYILDKGKIDKRIVFKGSVTRDEAVKIQKESTVVVNPRRPDNLITRYSFPSKTMEYLSSMTPMIGYHLDGIPEEYYKYMFTPKDLSIDSMSQLIDDVLNLPVDVLEKKANEARSFIVNNKNSEFQVKRILDFINE